MNKRFHTGSRAVAVTAAGTLAALAVAPAAVAADGDVEVANTETIQVYTDSTGAVKSTRVYEQIAMTGTGAVDLANPIETDGLRNLDEFGGFDVEDGQQITRMSVDGEERLRSVSDFSGDLPLTVDVRYFLDGESVEPGDVVGEAGSLEVLYTVTNVTSVGQEISYADGSGGTVTETVAVPIPMVGSLTTIAPPNFTDVQSDQANIAGDGKGGTRLSFTMTLFPPLGSDTAEFGYTATISDGVVPQADISALPVNPLASPTFKTAADSYESGATTGVTLADGAGQIDGNLLKLRDGAGDLLAGLIRLRDGSTELQAGLSGDAAPGARRLADGAGDLDSGLGQIDSGARRLADGSGRLRAGTGDLTDGTGRLRTGANQLAGGAGRLSDGTGDALAGSKKLTGGLRLISGGLDTLAGDKGLPAAQAGIKALRHGVDQIIAGFGDVDNPASLIGGLAALESGLTQLETGAGTLSGGLQVLVGNVPAQSPGLKGAKGGVDQVQAGLADAVRPGGSVDQLIGGLSLLKSTDCGPICDGIIDTRLIPGAQESKAKLTEANAGLIQVSGGLGSAIVGLEGRLIPGANQIRDGLTQARTGSTKARTGAVQLKAGAQQVGAGLDELSGGVTSAVDGVLRLANGADSAVSGSSELSTGLGTIDAGAGELANGAGRIADGTDELDVGAGELAAGAGRLDDGANQLADGTGEAASGSGRLADGADELAGGLLDAADGSGRLADGLEEAAGGAPQLVDGAKRLSDEGTTQLVEAGEDTAQTYGELFATIKAGSERARSENMAYGAPEGAEGLTAYSFVIQGEDGEDGRNLARGLGGLAVLGLGIGALALRRRFA